MVQMHAYHGSVGGEALLTLILFIESGVVLWRQISKQILYE